MTHTAFRVSIKGYYSKIYCLWMA
ncbi:hypothetical protein MTBLM5_50180 [Magnetospirillum sp. LM-5]|nr:hypothetical protein MTBLM5_50180 [Magnetospirillum sp. LM-5]